MKAGGPDMAFLILFFKKSNIKKSPHFKNNNDDNNKQIDLSKTSYVIFKS